MLRREGGKIEAEGGEVNLRVGEGGGGERKEVKIDGEARGERAEKRQY